MEASKKEKSSSGKLRKVTPESEVENVLKKTPRRERSNLSIASVAVDFTAFKRSVTEHLSEKRSPNVKENNIRGIRPLSGGVEYSEIPEICGKKLQRINIPRGNSCLIDAILRGFFIPYILGKNPAGETINKMAIVHEIRKNLKEFLEEKDGKKTNHDKYDQLTSMESSVPDFKLVSMSKDLTNNDFLGCHFIYPLSDVMGINIIVLNSDSFEVEAQALIRKEDPYVILLYFAQERHFESIGMTNDEGVINTLFKFSHPLISDITKNLRK